MPEKFSSQLPHARIAQTVEQQAGKEFGPEGLKRTDLARALNVKEGDISDIEWREISEFAVNAGAELIQTAITPGVPERPRMREVRELRKRIQNNADGLIPYHDIFHAAAIYRETNGAHAAARFIEVGPRERYTDVHAMGAELYPLLFFVNPRMSAPMSVLLYSPEGRKQIADFFGRPEFPEETVENIKALLLKDDTAHAKDRRTQYETFVEYLLIGNAKSRLPDLTAGEASSMQGGFEIVRKDPPELYANFAPRVFSEEWRNNPRLFLDELLACIRTKPEVSPIERPHGTR